MRSFSVWLPITLFLGWCCQGSATAQAQSPGAARVEPGLETAVKWIWWVAPSEEKDWGLPVALPETAKTAGGTPGGPPPPNPDSYEVKKGDALIIIARKFHMRVDQLKLFNGLASDMIRVGQVLKIPNAEQLKAMAPPPPPPKETTESAGKKKQAPEPAKAELGFDARRELENVLLQVFLDREQFSAGPIDGKSSQMLSKVAQLYLGSRDEVKDVSALREIAQAVLGDPYDRYTLRAEDFRFIHPPKPDKDAPKSKTKQGAKITAAPVTYEDLTGASFLAYRNPWEFVAERFHCDESFLRRLNWKLKGTPAAGTEFQVPKVAPFEIEQALPSPLQPAASDKDPMTAAVVEMTRLEIRRDGKLVAVMPLASARPNLRGRNSWTILDAVPRPRLATRQELKELPQVKTMSLDAIPTAPAVPYPTLEKDQYLAAGPNNPLGVVWINLAKSKSTEPLPYGLHGTSIPEKMNSQEGIGGLRLANWNIVRAVRMLPPGTPLQWKTR